MSRMGLEESGTIAAARESGRIESTGGLWESLMVSKIVEDFSVLVQVKEKKGGKIEESLIQQNN